MRIHITVSVTMKQYSFCHSPAQIARKRVLCLMGQKYGTQCLKKSEGLGPSLYLKEKLLLMLLNNIFIHI